MNQNTNFVVSKEVQEALDALGKLASAKIGSILSQYLGVDEKNIAVAFIKQKNDGAVNEKDVYIRILAHAPICGLFFEATSAAEEDDIKINLVHQSETKKLEILNKVFNNIKISKEDTPKSTGFMS